MLKEKIEVEVSSEVGGLEAVIIHTPGPEVENMTPQNAERALYSDILNLSEASKEYKQFKEVLKMHSTVLEVKDLLCEVLKNDAVKDSLLTKICANENIYGCKNEFLALKPSELAKALIQGVELKKNTLTNYLSNERYMLSPLHNFFFTRDTSACINKKVIVSRMANVVREREALIMEAIFNYHPKIQATTHNPVSEINFDKNITIEGGDVLVARNDVLIVGNSIRTSAQAVDYILEKIKPLGTKRHIIVQELPYTPESFIHLDMVFTFLSPNEVMIYEPVVMNPNQFKTILITIKNSYVSINEHRNILEVLSMLSFKVEPILCGGNTDPWIQEREQWHSGANFFAMGPGKLISYGRNVYTLEEMNKNGYEIIKARDLVSKKRDVNDYSKYVVTINSSELSRGGGGCRCMTLPIRRKSIAT